MPLSHISALILAAGKGTRMCSTLPKVMQRILDEPMLSYVMDAAKAVCGDRVWTVVGYQSDVLRAAYPEDEAALSNRSSNWAPGTPCRSPGRH